LPVSAVQQTRVRPFEARLELLLPFFSLNALRIGATDEIAHFKPAV